MQSHPADVSGAQERIHTRRASRYAMPVPLRFRPEGHDEWRDAVIENISGSGILFAARECSNIDKRLEFIFFLPGTGAAQVTCVGRVARVTSRATPGGRCTIAVTIDSYQLERSSAKS